MSKQLHSLAREARARFGIVAWSFAQNRAEEARQAGDFQSAADWNLVAVIILQD